MSVSPQRQLPYLQQLLDDARRIAVLTGAGMSTESGIPISVPPTACGRGT